jgi:AraC-like DNA-binding protein
MKDAVTPLEHAGHPSIPGKAETCAVPLRIKDQTAHAPSGPVALPNVKVVFTLSGWARVASSTGEVALEAGTILTIPPGLECSGFPVGHARTVTFYFHPDYLADQMRWLPLRHPLVHCLHRALKSEPALHTLHLGSAAMRDLAPRLVSLSQFPDGEVTDFTMLSIASDVFDAVGRLSGQARGTVSGSIKAPDREVAAAVALLRTHLRRRWSVKELAQAVALSPSQLTRLFRAQLGMSPAAFLRQLRSERMAELLATTRMSIGDAAEAVGWRDLATASRSFKQRFGIAPSAYANTCDQPFSLRYGVTTVTPSSVPSQSPGLAFELSR